MDKKPTKSRKFDLQENSITIAGPVIRQNYKVVVIECVNIRTVRVILIFTCILEFYGRLIKLSCSYTAYG